MKLRCPQAQQKLPTLNVFARLLYQIIYYNREERMLNSACRISIIYLSINLPIYTLSILSSLFFFYTNIASLAILKNLASRFT